MCTFISTYGADSLSGTFQEGVSGSCKTAWPAKFEIGAVKLVSSSVMFYRGLQIHAAGTVY